MAGNNEPGEDAMSNHNGETKLGTTGDEAVDNAQEALNNLTQTRLPELSRDRYESVNHPAHYGGDTTYETIKVIQAWGLGFEIGTVVKHLSRAGKKPGADYLEDLEKAKFYLQAEIDRVKAIG